MKIAWKTRAAEEWLARTKSPRVLHVFERSCNLVNEQGEVVSINFPGVPRTPLSLTLANTTEPRQTGSWRVFLDEESRIAVSFSQQVLLVGSLALAWGDAVRWNTVPDWASGRRGLRAWPAGTARLQALCQTESPPGSLAPLLELDPSNSGVALPSHDQAGLNARLLKKAGPLASSLIAAVAAGAPDLVAESAAALAGLGTGLTPSGDDFLMGVMHALWTWMEAAVASARSTWIFEAAAPRTSALSRAWLQTAAQGEAGEHWHGLLAALGQRDARGLARNTRCILETGHSSGADALAGFLMTATAIPDS